VRAWEVHTVAVWPIGGVAATVSLHWRHACFGFLSREYLTDVRHMLSVGFSAREVLALRRVWPIPLADFMARNRFRLRGNVPGHPPAQWAGCSLAEWMWNSAVDCFLRTHWATVAIVGGYPLYRMHHASGLAVNAVAGVDVYTYRWEPAQLGELKASLERVLGGGLVELDERDFGARELGPPSPLPPLGPPSPSPPPQPPFPVATSLPTGAAAPRAAPQAALPA